MQTGDFETALEKFDAILKKLPGDAATLTSRGHALKTRGDSNEAVDSYHKRFITTTLMEKHTIR